MTLSDLGAQRRWYQLFKIFQETQEKIRPKSANHKGMIALLLENQDEEELEKLGMKVCQAFLERSVEVSRTVQDLMVGKTRRFSTDSRASPPEEEAAPTPQRKFFVPKRRSRESTSSNEEVRPPAYTDTTVSRVAIIPLKFMNTLMVIQTRFAHRTSRDEGIVVPLNTVPPTTYQTRTTIDRKESIEKSDKDRSDMEIDLSLADFQTKVCNLHSWCFV